MAAPPTDGFRESTLAIFDEIDHAMMESEALLMKLAPAIGRPRAHAVVKELSDRARRRAESFSDAVRSHPVVREHLSEAEAEDCLSYRTCLGETGVLVPPS